MQSMHSMQGARWGRTPSVRRMSTVCQTSRTALVRETVPFWSMVCDR